MLVSVPSDNTRQAQSLCRLSAACLTFGGGFVFTVIYRCWRPWPQGDGPSHRHCTKHQCKKSDSTGVGDSREKGDPKVSGCGPLRYLASHNEPDPKQRTAYLKLP